MTVTGNRPDPQPAPLRAAAGSARSGERRLRIRRRLERLIGIAATEGNALLPLRNGDEIFPAMLDAIRSAEHTLDMMTFVYWRGDIARRFAEALSDRARNGVDQRVCQLAGQRYYEDLLACGVRIWQYQPTMMHAKVITVDGVAALLIGSTNFNRRSLEHDEEVMLTVLDEPFTAVLDAHYDEDLQVSERIMKSRWKRRPVPQRLGEALMNPVRRFL